MERNVLTSRTLVCAGLLSGLLLAAPDAEARFGKRSSSSSSDKSSSKTHEATAVGDEDSGGDDDDDSSSSSSSSSSYRGSRRAFSWLNLLGVVVDVAASTSSSETTYVAPEPVAEPEYRVDTRAESAPLTFRLGVDGSGLGGGSTVGFYLGIEGETLGVASRYNSLTLPTDDGTVGTDEIGLFEAHLTVALWTSPRGRWRLEFGMAGASAPDITFIGPSLASSLEACLAGPLDFEARLQIVPVPYRQVDAQVGLALHFNALNLRAGWRGLVLDDAGYVGDVRHVDAFTGPYAGVGLTF
jgi:hypothetical protein